MHTKRIAVGKGKKPKWFTTAKPGPYRKDRSMTLLYVIREVLKYADNAREAERIIHNGLVIVNKKAVREPKKSVGLMDVIDIPKLKKQYRVIPVKGKLELREITETESNIKPCRIVDKQTLGKDRIQINLHDGTTMLLNKSTFNTKDTLVLEIPSRKIKDIFEYKKGNTALIYHGRHSGEVGVITEITPGSATMKSKTKVGDIETLTDYVFVIGKDKPSISI
ncbi:MAG: 30S ribosomal protein S4e [Candidatus Altiarchaeota archaeon]